MKSWSFCAGVGVALMGAAGLAHAYSVTTYQSPGASRIEACSLATKRAESATQESVHGRLKGVSACHCDESSDAKASRKWQCTVEATREH
jgi:hypothetical protein